MTLNGQPVGRPDGGVSPLVAGVDVSSSNLTPPLPGPGAGTLSGGQMAVVQFDLRVNDGVPPGTVISNQAVVDTAELPNLLDRRRRQSRDRARADRRRRRQPAAAQDHEGRRGRRRRPGDCRAPRSNTRRRGTNVGLVPAYHVVLRDDIAVPVPGYLAFVDGSYTMNGSTNGITVAGLAADRGLL